MAATTVGDLLKELGDIPAWRVRLHPTPGTATEKDLLRVVEREKRPCAWSRGPSWRSRWISIKR